MNYLHLCVWVFLGSLVVFFCLKNNIESDSNKMQFEISDLKKDINRLNEDIEFLFRTVIYDS